MHLVSLKPQNCVPATRMSAKIAKAKLLAAIVIDCGRKYKNCNYLNANGRNSCGLRPEKALADAALVGPSIAAAASSG